MRVLCRKRTTEGPSRTAGQVRILRETWINDPILPTVENGWHLWPDHHTCVKLMGKFRTQNAKHSNKRVFLLAKKFEAQVRSANLEPKSAILQIFKEAKCPIQATCNSTRSLFERINGGGKRIVSKCNFEIVFDRTDRTYEAGEQVTGTLRLTVNKTINCRNVRVTACWKTHGLSLIHI